MLRSFKIITVMKQTKNTQGACAAPADREIERDARHQCTCCGRTLPLTEFYVNARTGRHDSRCKECRRESSRRQRTKDVMDCRTTGRRRYPVITETADPVLRMALIRRALRTVEEKKRVLKMMNDE